MLLFRNTIMRLAAFIFAFFIMIIISGCTASPEQKAQQEKLLNEHNGTVKNLTFASNKATSFVAKINQDHQEALKDNAITKEESDNLKKQCADRLSLSSFVMALSLRAS